MGFSVVAAGEAAKMVLVIFGWGALCVKAFCWRKAGVETGVFRVVCLVSVEFHWCCLWRKRVWLGHSNVW